MKTIISLCGILTFCSLLAKDQGLNWNVRTSLASKYLGTMGTVISDDPSFVNEVVASRNDHYVGLWTATGIGRGKYGETFKDELDPYVGFFHTWGPLKYEMTAIYFAVADLGHANDDLWGIDQQVSLNNIHEFKPYVTVRSLNRIGSKSPEGGWYLWVGIKKEQSFGRYKLNIDLMTSYSDGPLGKSPGQVYYKAALNLPIPISQSVTLVPSFGYQIPTTAQRNARFAFARNNEFVFEFSMCTSSHQQ